MLVNLKEILKYAEDNKCAVGMFNATGFDSLQAIIKAAEKLNQPVILAHAEVHNVYNDISLVAPVMLSLAKNSKVPVCVHLDHGTTLEMIKRAINLGFTSIMIDASSLPFEENIKFTKQVVDMCHPKNISVEGEIGQLITSENGTSNKPKSKEYYYTKPNEAKEFVEKTNVDALAIAFGTAHGFYKEKPLLDVNVIKNVKKVVNVPLVMHGGSGLSKEQFQDCIKAGIRKINYYSYMSKAGYEAAKKLIESNKTSYLHDVEFEAMKAMEKNVEEAIKIFSMKD